MMASGVHIVIVGGSRHSGHETLAGDARAYLEHLEQRWSRFLPDSDVSRINNSNGRSVEVHADTITLFDAMVDAWHRTGGGFDPTVLPVLIANGYGTSIDDSGRSTTLPPIALRVGGVEDIVIDHERRTIIAPPDVVVDPGGIGKGLAADLAATRLVERGAAGALVTIGGDLAMVGTPPEPTGWLVTVERADPGAGDLCTLVVDHGGVATSSTRSRRWLVDGQSRHHVIDPISAAQATTDLLAVTVIARTGWLAEVHATEALLAGSAHVIEVLDSHELSGIALRVDGPPLTTTDLDWVGSTEPAVLS
jgi:thiamine biosynthesis lipoprotein